MLHRSTASLKGRAFVALATVFFVCSAFQSQPPALPGRFEVESDLLLAQFDSKTDVDDIHSIAAVATMLADPRLSEVNYHAVAGAYGIQEGLYVPANELFENAFGAHWSDAHADFDQALREVTALVTETLDAGGDVWVAEAGQSDFTAALIRRVKDASPQVDTEERIHVVQHSGWNEDQATPEELDYVKANAFYHKIADGNAADNGTPIFRTSEAADWRSYVRTPELARVWEQALEIANTYNGTDGRYTNPDIADGGMDFSDVVEVCWIFGFEDLADAEAFFQAFATPE